MSIAFRYLIDASGVFHWDSPDMFAKTMASRKKRAGWMVPEEDGFYESDKMRRYYFGVIVPMFADHMGYRRIDSRARDRISKDILVEIGWCEEVRGIHGEVKQEAKSISRGRVKKEEFQELIDAAIQSAAEMGILIPDAKSKQSAQMMAGNRT